MLAVDGASGAPGLELSHWPGNRTPPELRHELSTGCALRWAGLGRERREALAAGCTAIVNNHYDTDGVLAMFVARHPERALERADALLAAAAAGDFFLIPDERALALDALVGGLNDPALSPFAPDFAGLDDEDRHTLLARWLADELAELVSARALPYPELWEPAVAAARDDAADLATCALERRPELFLAAFVAPAAARSRRADAGGRFDPGRHPLFQIGDADRVLVHVPDGAGGTWRLIVSTRSWFDLPGPPPPPRPDLVALAGRLNEREGAAASDEHAWRAQAREHASPELWFGRAEHPSFAEHCAALAPSRLAAELVRAEIDAALLG